MEKNPAFIYGEMMQLKIEPIQSFWHFLALPVYEGSNTIEKTEDSSDEMFFTSRRILIEISMTESNRVFFGKIH